MFYSGMSVKEKLSRARYWASDTGRATARRYWKSKKGKATRKAWCKSPKGLAYRRAQFRKLRDACLQAYCNGEPRCMCPGCSVKAAAILEIDQTKSGKSHRKFAGIGIRFYRWLKRHNFPKGFRVVCPNCHKARHLKIPCPHHRPLLKAK
jgi:hypothetical protein